MTADEVAAFINKSRVRGSYVMPAIGRVGNPYGVYRAKARGQKLVIVMAGEPYSVVPVFVRDIISTRPDMVRVVCDESFPEQAIDFVAINPGDKVALKDYYVGLDEVEDSDDIDNRLATVIDQELAVETVYPDPELNTAVRFVRWSEWVMGQGVVGAGIIAHSEDDSRLLVVTFPGFEADAKNWHDRFDGHTPPSLDTLSDWAGRTTFVTHPETIKGASHMDAAMRALHKFAAEIYKETGRSVFP